MSLQELLDLEIKNQGEDNSGSSKAFFEVARTQVNACWYVFGNSWQENKQFIYVPMEGNDLGKQARADAYAYLEEINRSGHPTQGFITTVFGDEVLNHPDGKYESGDWHDFTNKWHQIANIEDLEKRTSPKLTLEELKERLNGKIMPYNAIYDALSSFGEDMPFGKAKWCLVEKIQNEWSFLEGVRDKNNFPYRTRVIRKIYKNKAEAVEDAENYKRESTNKATPQLSTMAKEHNMTIENIKVIAPDVIEKRAAGIPDDEIAAGWKIEVSDLKIATEEALVETPF